MSNVTKEIRLTSFNAELGWYKTDFECPGSTETNPHHFNVKELLEGLWIAWCGNGPCPSYVANDGAVGTSPEEACKILEELVSNDPKLPPL